MTQLRSQVAAGELWRGIIEQLRTGNAGRVARASGVAVALLAAVGSVWSGVRRATPGVDGFGSRDFQWSPTRLLLHGVDPYQARLDGSEDIILTQSPNYLHLLYWVMTPFGALPFTTAALAWAVLNVVLAAGTAAFYARCAGLGRTGTLLLVAGLLCSTPFRLGLSNGQHAVLVLACATMAFAASSRSWAGAPLALALTKYSFAPLALVLLVKGSLRTVLGAIAVLLVAAVGLAAATRTGLVDALLEPLRLGRAFVGGGTADLVKVLDLTPWFSAADPVLPVLGVLVALVLAAATAQAVRRGDWVLALGVGAVISLLCFRHLVHDLVFLLPVVVLVLRMRGLRAVAGWSVLTHHWLLVGVMSQLGTPSDAPGVVLVSFASLAVLLWLLVSDPSVRQPAAAGSDVTLAPGPVLPVPRPAPGEASERVNSPDR